MTATPSLYTLYYRSPRLLLLTVSLLLVAGATAWWSLPRQEDPRITPSVAIVTTRFAGASAQRVEALVTEPIEREVRLLSAVETLTTTSAPGVSVLVAELDDTLTRERIARAKSRIRDAVQGVRLPQGARPPEFDGDRFGAYTLVLGLRWSGPATLDRGILGRLAHELADRLQSVPGTELVRVYGSPREEVEVRLRPSAYFAGWSPARVAEALRRSDAELPAGRWNDRQTSYVVSMHGKFDTLDRLRDAVLDSRVEGALRVGDLARVRFSTEQPATQLGIVDGKPGVLVAARILPDEKTGSWSREARRAAASFAEELPPGLELMPVFDQSRFTRQRLEELGTNLLWSVAIVLVVLLVTLGLRPALVVTAALPLSLTITLAGLFYLGIPLHQMSITGLIGALGLLVDNAIVVTDAVRQRLTAGSSRLEAVGSTVQELWLPLLASTVTTVIAFLPIVLLPGQVGEFVGAIGISVILTVVGSYLVAIAIVTALAGHWLPRSSPAAPGGSGPAGDGARSTGATPLIALAALGKGLLRRSLALVLTVPRLALLSLALVPLLGFILVGTLPNQFFPPSDRNQLRLQLWLPDQADINATRELVQHVDATLRQDAVVQEVHWTLGRSSPSYYYNVTEWVDGTGAFAQALINVEGPEQVHPFMRRMQPRLDVEHRRARIVLKEFLQGPRVAAPVEFRVYGPDIVELQRIGSQLRERLSRVAGVVSTNASLDRGLGRLEVIPDAAALERVGLRENELARDVSGQVSGEVGGYLVEGRERLPVRVRGHLGELASAYVLARASPAAPSRAAGQARARLAGPTPVPLSALARTAVVPDRAVITRRNGSRVNIVQAETSAGLLPSVAQARVDRVLAEDPVPVPRGYRIEVGGDVESRQEAEGDLAALVAPLLVLLVAVLVLTFQSFRAAAIVFAVAVASVGLGLLSLALGGFPFAFQSLIGLLGLMGIAVNDAIVVLTELRHDAAAAEGDIGAIVEVVAERTSPHVVSTSLTTFGGFVPLLLSGGLMWPPFACVIAFGVALATLLALYFVPPAFLLMVRSRRSSATVQAPGATMACT